MNALESFLDRMRSAWDDLNDRERRMVLALGVLGGVFLLGFPSFYTARQNAEIEEENDQIRQTLELIARKKPQLELAAEARKQALARYRRQTPALGTFLEEQANKHKLAVREVTDQPEKASGNFNRRSVRASISEVSLTGVMDLLTGIVTSEYPVAIDQIQIEHYQPGDSYRFKIGVLTFDKQAKPASDDKSKGAAASEPSEG